MKRAALACVLLAFAAGCLGQRNRVVELHDVDGSADHRLFRIGAATRVMLEPVLWRLEDRKLIDFDRPVTAFFKDKLPPEFEDVTLRMLHDNASGLPDDFLDPLSPKDIHTRCMSRAFGTNPWREFNARDAFVARLWDERIREAVKLRKAQPSTIGAALLMMAVCDRLNKTLDDLCQAYLIEPYGLKDTAFVPEQGMRNRLTAACAGSLPFFAPAGSEIHDHRGEGEAQLFSSGLLTSASDLLRVCYVILPHLERAKGIFETRKLDDGRSVSVFHAETAGGRIFLGFDPKDRHVALILRNDTGFTLSEGYDLLEELAHPPSK